MKANNFFILITILLISEPCFAVFKDPGFGARPMAMGGAFTAVSDDSNAPLYNPAGIAQIERPELGLMYAKLFTGIDNVDLGLQYVSFVYPVEQIGCFGLSWTDFTAAYHKENTMNLTYSADILNLLEFTDYSNIIYFGVNIKNLSHSYVLDDYSKNDPVFVSGNSKSGFTADLGLWLNLISDRSRVVSAGLSAQNIIETDMGMKTEDMVPMVSRIGVAYKLIDLNSIKNLLITSDLVYRNIPSTKNEDNFDLAVGAEAWFLNELLAARLGGNTSGISCGFGFKQSLGNFSIGLDYALLWPIYVKSSSSHRVSLSCSF